MSVNTLDAATLWAAVRAAPDDDTGKLVLADYLEENGDASTGYALRWCVARGHWPRLTSTLAIWYTDASQRHTGSRREVLRATLPIPFFVIAADCQRLNQLPGVPSGVAYRTLTEAAEYLGYVLAWCRHHAALEAT